MNKITVKIIVFAIAGAIFASGCEEEIQTNTKKSRLIAAENMRLKKDLEQCRKEIEKQEKLVEKCLKDKEGSIEKLEEDVRKASENDLSDFEKILELREENEKLKLKIEQLEKK